MPCIFCEIVAGRAPSHRVWEDEEHLAFLSIFPNTPGVTIVVPKQHFGSYVFALPDEVTMPLLRACTHVARRLDAAFEDVGRTALVMEGFGIDHLHAKLYPLHGTRQDEWKPILSDTREFFTHYDGHLSTNDGPRADDAQLALLAQRIARVTLVS